MTDAVEQEEEPTEEDRPWIDAVPSLRELCEYFADDSVSWDGKAPLLECRYPLHAAAYFNHAAITAHLLHWGATTDYKTEVRTAGGETALHVACAAGHLDCVRLLVERGGANVRQLCAAGWSPLRKAVKGGHAPTVLYLLQRGVATPENVLLVMIGRDYHPQRQRGLVNILLRHKVNLKCRDHRGNTIFHIAAQAEQQELLELLLAHDEEHVDLEDVNQEGDTPLSHLWLSSMAVPADSAEETKVIGTARVLLQAGADGHTRTVVGGAPLMHSAITKRRIAILLEYGMDINTTLDKQGRTALNYRAFLNKTFDAYLEHGADVTIADSEGLLPLHWACFHRNQSGLRQLLRAPAADVNATFGSCRRTALHLLAMADRAALDADKDLTACIQILLEHHANLNASDTDCGWTALHHTAFRSLPLPVLEALLANGADVSIRDKAGRTALHLLGLHLQYRHNARLNGLVDILLSSDNDGGTESAQQLVHQHGYLDVVMPPIRHGPTTTLCVTQALVRHGASAIALDNAGNLPFFLAASMERVDATFVMIKTAAHQGLFPGNLYE